MTQNHNGKILLVDDEQMLVDLGVMQIQRLGYQAVGTVDPHEALQWITDNPHHWSIVISDYTMPLMSGMELARAVYSINPSIAVLLSSGYGVLLEDDLKDGSNVVAVLEKPVDVAQLASTIQKFINPASS